jgi:hypothetical protein
MLREIRDLKDQLERFRKQSEPSPDTKI